jgi:hypothetical protein
MIHGRCLFEYELDDELFAFASNNIICKRKEKQQSNQQITSFYFEPQGQKTICKTHTVLVRMVFRFVSFVGLRIGR